MSGTRGEVRPPEAGATAKAPRTARSHPGDAGNRQDQAAITRHARLTAAITPIIGVVRDVQLQLVPIKTLVAGLIFHLNFSPRRIGITYKT